MDLPICGETRGSEHQILRYLKPFVAWHAAAASLLDGRFRHIVQNLNVGLIEVTPNKPKPMTEEVIQEQFRRYPKQSPELDEIFIENTIKKNHKEATFIGTTDVLEVTLMNLLSIGSSFVNHNLEIKGVDVLNQLVESVRLFFPYLPVHFLDVGDFGNSDRC